MSYAELVKYVGVASSQIRDDDLGACDTKQDIVKEGLTAEKIIGSSAPQEPEARAYHGRLNRLVNRVKLLVERHHHEARLRLAHGWIRPEKLLRVHSASYTRQNVRTLSPRTHSAYLYARRTSRLSRG